MHIFYPQMNADERRFLRQGGNRDDAEMDCLAIAIGKLDVCLQSTGRQPFAKAKMKSVNSGGRPLHYFIFGGGCIISQFVWLNSSVVLVAYSAKRFVSPNCMAADAP